VVRGQIKRHPLTETEFLAKKEHERFMKPASAPQSHQPCREPLAGVMTNSQHVYEVRLRKDKRGVDLNLACPAFAFRVR